MVKAFPRLDHVSKNSVRIPSSNAMAGVLVIILLISIVSGWLP